MSKSLRLIVFGLTMVGLLGAQSGTVSNTGIAVKKPVFGGACKLCPWGAMADVVKNAMTFYGYDVKICHNCNAAESTRIVSGAKLPPPYKVDPAVSAVMAPPNEPGLGPIDFGATAEQFLCASYHGNGAYAKDKPMTNLRLIANIQSPVFLVVAAKAETGITDLSQIRQKRWPVKINASPGDATVKELLAYYGLTVDEIKAAGGAVGGDTVTRDNFDIIIHSGAMSTAPEWNILNEVAMKYNLNYLDIPEPVLAKLLQAPLTYRGYIPVGMLRGVERTIPTVVRNGTVVYTRNDVPDSFAYDVAKALDQHQDELQWSNQNFSYNRYNVTKACDVPLHPGAARYYKEVGYIK